MPVFKDLMVNAINTKCWYRQISVIKASQGLFKSHTLPAIRTRFGTIGKNHILSNIWYLYVALFYCSKYDTSLTNYTTTSKLNLRLRLVFVKSLGLGFIHKIQAPCILARRPWETQTIMVLSIRPPSPAHPVVAKEACQTSSDVRSVPIKKRE